MAEEGSDTCYLKECADGMYLSVDSTGTHCLQCDSSCKTCVDKESCIECQQGLIPITIGESLVRCEGCSSGYQLTDVGTCEGTIY